MMFETNTASCGGFPGISNSYGAALWGLDYALQMAYYNFTGALFHVGGRDVFYNVRGLFGCSLRSLTADYSLLHVGHYIRRRALANKALSAPPTNETVFRQWTIGPLFYSTIVAAEIFGTTGTARVVDLNANSGNTYTPAYAIYENNVVSKIAIFNYLNDPSVRTIIS
jgi:hypothetical protein